LAKLELVGFEGSLGRQHRRDLILIEPPILRSLVELILDAPTL